MVQQILQQVGAGLGYAHKRGIIHRDVKPANVMVDTEGWAVVTDFGIAKVTETKGLTMTGATVGTPSYKSPERSEEHTSELQSHVNLVCRLLLEKKNRL